MRKLLLVSLFVTCTSYMVLNAPLEIANWFHAAALEANLAGNLDASIDYLNRAIEWSPNSTQHYNVRAEMFQRLGRHEEAIRDHDRIVEISRPSNQVQLSLALNGRAYARAIGQLELNDALEDIELAIASDSQVYAAFLDTRGYIYYLLGDMDAAEQDLKQATEIAVKEHSIALEQIHYIEFPDAIWQKNQRKKSDHYLAVFYHHLGLVYDKQQRPSLAERYLTLGDALGYDPTKGVW